MKMIIFDMDGTLINSGYAIANTVNYVRENLGFSKLEKEHILEKLNDVNINTAQFFYGTQEFTLQQQKLFESYYNENCLCDLRLYDGIKELLDSLKKDFKLSIATNANSYYARKMLNHLQIEDYFCSIVGYNDVKRPKPNSDMVDIILEKHNIKKENAQLIGDSNKDILAAFNAGIDSVLVNWGFTKYPHSAINTVLELEEKIKTKFFK